MIAKFFVGIQTKDPKAPTKANVETLAKGISGECIALQQEVSGPLVRYVLHRFKRLSGATHEAIMVEYPYKQGKPFNTASEASTRVGESLYEPSTLFGTTGKASMEKGKAIPFWVARLQVV